MLPGYFWLFPCGKNIANNGIGLSKEQAKNDPRKLTEILDDVINSNFFRARFKDSEKLETPKGWSLTLGKTKRTNHGNGFMLLGDAAGLIDPFTGEGIGNALLSAKLTSQFFDSQEHAGGFPADQAAAYMEALWGDLGNELSNSYRLQGMVKRKRLMSWFVRRASKKPKIGEILTEMIASKESQENLYSKWFLFKTIVLP